MKRLLLVLAVSLIMSQGMVSAAIPGTPNQFYGSVINNNQLAPDGFKVSAKIDGAQVAYSTTENGIYTLIVKDQESRLSGKTVSFFVEDTDTKKTAIFCNGCITEVDLTSFITTSTQYPVENSGGSSTSSSSGTSNIPATTTAAEDEPEPEDTETIQSSESELNEDTCTEKWICTDWTDCINSIQKRKCIDKNECGTENDKPFESEPCSVIEEYAKEQELRSVQKSPSGFASLITLENRKNTIIIIGLIILLALILIVYSKNIPSTVTSSKTSKKNTYAWGPKATSNKGSKRR